MAVIYLDSAYAGSQGAASGDLGHGAGNIWTRPDQYWASAANGDNVYFRDDRVWVPNARKIFTLNGIDNKRLIIDRYGNGSAIPFIDGSHYEDTVSGWSHIGSGVWQKTINVGGGWSATNSQSMWTGAIRPGTAKSSWVRGTMHRRANGNYASGFVNGNNPLNGNGIWWTYASGSNYIAQVWTGNSGASGDPITVYGGLRFIDGNGTTGAAELGLVFIGAGANDSEVHEIACFGFRKAAMGSCDQGSDGTVNGLLFDSVHMLGTRRGLFTQSSVVDTLVRNVELSGQWVYDDYVDTSTAPTVLVTDTEDHNNWEAISIDNRSQDVIVSNGTIIVGGGHGALNIVPSNQSGDGGQTRPARITVDGTRVRINRAARNSRAFAIQTTDDVRLSRVKFTGGQVNSKALGNRTVITQCEFSAWGACLAAQDDGTNMVSMPAAIGMGTIHLTFANNLMDGRGRAAVGATMAYACFQLKSTANNALPANSLVLDNNVFIGDSGCAAVRVLNGPNPGVQHETNPNQTIRQNWWNTGASAVECYLRVGGEAVAGTATTIAAYFTTGTISDNTEKTLGEIASGGGARPMTPMNKVPVDRLPV
ncbi:MAG: hypothetical protein KA760_15415 [Steroidobacteraceae bacterium]|nr:hypothetical protein [Steroidobacteraceae bacterium]